MEDKKGVLVESMQDTPLATAGGRKPLGKIVLICAKIESSFLEERFQSVGARVINACAVNNQAGAVAKFAEQEGDAIIIINREAFSTVYSKYVEVIFGMRKAGALSVVISKTGLIQNYKSRSYRGMSEAFGGRNVAIYVVQKGLVLEPLRFFSVFSFLDKERSMGSFKQFQRMYCSYKRLGWREIPCGFKKDKLGELKDFVSRYTRTN